MPSEPIDATESQDRGRERQNMPGVGLGQVEDKDLSADGQKRDHHHCLNLDDPVLALRDDQERLLELKRDDHGEDHAEHSLEG